MNVINRYERKDGTLVSEGPAIPPQFGDGAIVLPVPVYQESIKDVRPDQTVETVTCYYVKEVIESRLSGWVRVRYWRESGWSVDGKS